MWADGAARYLKESANKRSADRIAGHVALLLPHIGALPLDQVHDGSLEPFISQRLASGVSGTTVNRSLEIARTVLVRCARSYRDDAGRPWLAGLPPLITMCEEDPRRPYPLSWDESDRLIAACPPHIAAMVEFALNVGSREGNITGLRWEWEQRVPEIGRSVFVVPASKFKTARPHVLILNDRAWAIVEAQRGKHPTHVFCWSSAGELKPVRRINNTAWRNARKRVGLAHVREHDLRHTFGARLRAEGVSPEDPATLLARPREPRHARALRISRHRPTRGSCESSNGPNCDAHGAACVGRRQSRAKVAQ